MHENTISNGLKNKDRKQIFEKFKENEASEQVNQIKKKVEIIKNLRSELNICISACNELKEKIDSKLKKLSPNEKRESKSGNEEDYKLQIEIKKLKIDHQEFLAEYKMLKKNYRHEEMDLLTTKRRLLDMFETYMAQKTGGINVSGNQKWLKNMDSAEIVFMNAKEKFQTIKKLKRIERN
jgi:hypothetical protein